MFVCRGKGNFQGAPISRKKKKEGTMTRRVKDEEELESTNSGDNSGSKDSIFPFLLLSSYVTYLGAVTGTE